jgi:Cu/Ag efflux protein CusF
MRSPALRILPLVVILLVALSWTASAQQGKKEFDFRGKVEAVDTKEKKVTVNNEKVDGWMAAMTMKYGVDKPEVLNTLKAGDRITAKVKEGDFQTLYDVRRVAPAGGDSSKK